MSEPPKTMSKEVKSILKNQKYLDDAQSRAETGKMAFLQMLRAQANVRRHIGEVGCLAVDELVSIMRDKTVNAHTRATVAFGIIDRTGNSTSIIEKDLHAPSNVKQIEQMSIEELTKAIESLDKDLKGLKVVDEIAVDKQ